MTEAEENAMRRIARSRSIGAIIFYAITLFWIAGVVIMAINRTYPLCYALGVIAALVAAIGVVMTVNYSQYRRDVEERLTVFVKGNIRSVLFLNGISYLVIDKKLYAFKGRNRGKFRMGMDIEIVYSLNARHILSKIVDKDLIGLL